ncbi:nicotinate phosphoribosyltransferase [Serendipita sp. 398]|nr:nicotinate phosphoribosyltransferase [Serendipita sp. 398]
MSFTIECLQLLKQAVGKLKDLTLTSDEKQWLSETCPYLSSEYLDYLEKYRFKPDQVIITFIPTPGDATKGQIEMEANGPWVETIMWEIVLMALLSEIYFQVVDTDWINESQEERAYEKGKDLLLAGCTFSEFGTRRRRSFKVQEDVVVGLIRAQNELQPENHGGKLLGTSNVHFAKKFGLTPIGTIAHEWFMGTAATFGYENSSIKALSLWEEVYTPERGSALWISLTDTFSTDVFFREFKGAPDYVKRWRLRQDSGDPIEYVKKAKALYDSLGVDASEKPIVFSDSLNVVKAKAIQKACDEAGLKASFGIGTFLSNDFQRSDGNGPSKALNMVIKLYSINNIPCVKISDDIGKNTGEKGAVKYVKDLFKIPEA